MEEIFDSLKDISHNYTLDMENKVLISKKEFYNRLEFNIDYKDCYNCKSEFTVKTPCGHFYCSKCFYENIANNIFGNFNCGVCGVCETCYARIASDNKMYIPDGNDHSDSNENEYSEEDLYLR